MKKTGGLLHAELSYVVARLGHGDSIVLADAGLPSPAGPTWIDLAVTPGVVGIIAVAEVISTEMKVERLVIASQLAQKNQRLASSLQA